MVKVAHGLKKDQRDRLQSLGFNKVIEKDSKTRELTRRLAIAYEHFRYVTPEKIDKFNQKLRKETKQKDGSHKYLAFEKISDTDLVPPDEVLTKLEQAKQLDCFDWFEIAYIAKVEDPIVFGVIEGCFTKFYVAQWDNDVRIEDILTSNEG